MDQDGRQVLGLMTGHQQQPVNQAAILENQNQVIRNKCSEDGLAFSELIIERTGEQSNLSLNAFY